MDPGTRPPPQGGPSPKTSVSFTLNGEPVVLVGAVPSLSLNEWIRAQPGLTGTKKMCGEGGCGCCIVAVTRMDPVARKETTVAINSVRRMLRMRTRALAWYVCSCTVHTDEAQWLSYCKSMQVHVAIML